MIGVEQWAEIRRLYFVEKRSKRAIHRLTGVHRDTITRAVMGDEPPRYARERTGSKLDPFKEWICAQLQADVTIQSLRLREMATELGYEGGKSIFDDYVREVRPRFVVPRTFQRTIYRPGELVQCDLWEPRELIPVGHGQLRRGYVVTAEVCWSRVIAGALIFSKEAPDILWGLGRCLGRIGGLGEKLVWDREGAIHAGGGHPTTEFASFCGQLGVGWVILDIELILTPKVQQAPPRALPHQRDGCARAARSRPRSHPCADAASCANTCPHHYHITQTPTRPARQNVCPRYRGPRHIGFLSLSAQRRSGSVHRAAAPQGRSESAGRAPARG